MKADTQTSSAVRRTIFVYEAARLHAMLLGCPVVPRPWGEREEEFKLQLIKLIGDLVAGRRKFPDSKTAHDSWMRKYVEMGWQYGEVYDPEKKTHPDLVRYEELDPKERVKDDVFLALVNIAKEYIW